MLYTSEAAVMLDQVHVSTHPLVLSRLAELRDKHAPPRTFRRLVREMSRLLFYEASAKLRLETINVNTPLAETEGHRLSERIGLVPVLRAGLGMVDGIHEMVPDAEVWHLGLYRDHETLEPVTYYNKLPAEPRIELAIVLDPMLATGGSAIASLDLLKRWGVQQLWFIGLIAAPEGVKRLREVHPNVPIFLAALDSHLNYKSYIVPGLGDAGDRQFATT
ncbi:MAG TPA: uracil phosphoribosyltransferase [Gemmatales bacterium]|nr:uracil phosphoribosyltransferase [Gemmatales bacterium]